ncbi:MAG: hypothetical protein CL816_03655 [Coxiellaceae bacterium]|nr:hypothetical protein [Coxiellaceae bacterium]|tara:strand:+ start:18985 stop:19671 length:687 start_codon:yes stop_codon:yes gene_type:complete
MPKTHLHRKLEIYNAQHITDALQPYVTQRRKDRIESVLEKRLSGIQLILEAPCDINNAFAILRTCECFGIQHLHVIQPKGEAMSLKRLTRGAWYWVDLTIYNSLSECLNQLPSSPYCLAGATLSGEQTLHELSIDQPLFLMLGNEQYGLSDEAIHACHTTYQIPMCGMTESFNLSVSAAISLYDTTQRKRKCLQAPGDLSLDEKAQLTARYFLNSVNHRLVNSLLPSA